MTTATPSSLTLSEKKRLWNEFKYDTFQQISQDRSTLFNWFLENNDIFGIISKEDQMKIKSATLHVQQKGATVFFGTLLGVFLIDNVLMRIALPSFRIPRLRFLVFTAKYLITPCLAYGINKEYFMEEEEEFFFNIQEKYSFGFEDYMKANRIFQRALEVDRLEELREKRQIFDWTGIPQLPPETEKK